MKRTVVCVARVKFEIQEIAERIQELRPRLGVHVGIM